MGPTWIRLTAIGMVLYGMGGAAGATTWTSTRVACPVCQTRNTFQMPGSWGGYIYGMPSKYQVVYWPFTEGMSLYTCRKCGHSALMDDFGSVPADKLEAVRKALSNVPFAFADGQYDSVPMSQRLPVAEKEYILLGQGNFRRCFFYRVTGYHLEQEAIRQQDQQQRKDLVLRAAEARRKALELAEAMLKDKANEKWQYDLYFIAGAMHHFLNDDTGARAALDEAHKIAEKSGDRGKQEMAEEYLKTIAGPGARIPGLEAPRSVTAHPAPAGVASLRADDRGLYLLLGLVAITALVAGWIIRARARRLSTDRPNQPGHGSG